MPTWQEQPDEDDDDFLSPEEIEAIERESGKPSEPIEVAIPEILDIVLDDEED